jgi:hypothetical protein
MNSARLSLGIWASALAVEAEVASALSAWLLGSDQLLSLPESA